MIWKKYMIISMYKNQYFDSECFLEKAVMISENTPKFQDLLSTKIIQLIDYSFLKEIKHKILY